MSRYAIFFIIVTANTFGVIRNYEDSENLRDAMTYCPSYARDKKLIDRETARKFYEAYLREYPDTVNRAKVLSRIGMNYVQYENDEKGVSRDYDLGRRYLQMAIEADPGFVCHETIVARTNLASIAERGDKRFAERLEACRWLEAVTDDQIRASIKREGTFQRPQRKYVDVTEEEKQEMAEELSQISSSIVNSEVERNVSALRSTLNTIKASAGTNLLSNAFSTTVPEVSLKRIAEELRGTRIAELAQAELDKISKRKLEQKKLPGSITPAAAMVEASSMEREGGEIEERGSQVDRGDLAAENIADGGMKTGGYPAVTGVENGWSFWKIALGGSGVFVVGGACVVLLRRRRS